MEFVHRIIERASRLFEKSSEPLVEEADIVRLADRHSFSQYLCYETYDAATREYGLHGDQVGYLWECVPVAFMTDDILERLASLFRREWPARTSIQFMLVPDDAIDGFLQGYLQMKTRKSALVQRAALAYAQHLSEGRKGLAQMEGLPVRNYRLVVSLKTSESLGLDRISQIEENLRAAALGPQSMLPGRFLELMRRLLNSHSPANAGTYDENRLLNRQIIQAETCIRVKDDYVQIGDRFAACLTPKSMPSNGQLDRLAVNALIGGFSGPEDDATQLAQKFLWSTTVFFQTTPSEIRNKASTMGMQRVGGTIAKDIARRNAEMAVDLEEMERDRFVNVMTAVWIFGEDLQALNRGLARSRGLWEQQKFVMQRESKIGIPMLITSLPMGLVESKGNKAVFQRDFVMSGTAATHLLPVQADFRGNMSPAQLYTGRKGQLITVDVFDRRANNSNFFVCAGSGAGKSFTMNKIVGDYYGNQALIRLVDIGYSYQKQCSLLGGRYIDIGREANRLCLNPFTTSRPSTDAEDSAGDELAIANVLLTMAFASVSVPTDDPTYFTLMKDAVRFAKQRDGGERGVDHVYEYLVKYPALADGPVYAGAAPLAHKMGFNLKDFTTQGRHGRLFNGKSTLNIGSDEFVVLELEQIMNDAELFQVIAMQVINAITQDLYLSDRSRRRFMVFDEAWRYFSGTPMIAQMIKEGYRRARKYGGATGIITQSPMDLKNFGEAGEVIISNSAFKFMLASDAYERAVAEGILSYTGLALDLLKSVRNNRPRYSEMFLDTPLGMGVARFCGDRLTYWMNTTDPGEVARFQKKIQAGLDPIAAIEQLLVEERNVQSGKAA